MDELIGKLSTIEGAVGRVVGTDGERVYLDIAGSIHGPVIRRVVEANIVTSRSSFDRTPGDSGIPAGPDVLVECDHDRVRRLPAIGIAVDAMYGDAARDERVRRLRGHDA